ncbi:Aldehyde/histidinol dehydrogenase [Entophlyctis helioformis]|nr:Aldehyde/histidinol dehydrogenase [Entophlyctis helioformis]
MGTNAAADLAAAPAPLDAHAAKTAAAGRSVYAIVSPVDQSTVRSVPLATRDEAIAAVDRSHSAWTAGWRRTPLAERKRIVAQWVDNVLAKREEVASQLSALIGRPLPHARNELRGFQERASHLLAIADESLQDTVLPETAFRRYIRREPLGVVLVIAAWNYPLLTSVNAVVPALLAGNTVLLKQAPQTFPMADVFAEAFVGTGIPEGVFQAVHMGHDVAEAVIQHPAVAHVQFTGSVRGGLEVCRAASSRLINVGLELGGKDPAYVRADADLDFAAENIIDGVMYNSGQSCCAIERVYVHESVYDAFIAKAVSVTQQYVLGHPLEAGVNLGPVVNVASADRIRGAVAGAVAAGAVPLIDGAKFALAKAGTAFVAPQLLANVNHGMAIMREETFGPVVGIMKVSSDEEAVRLMNDSQYGLTASVWTRDMDAALLIGDQLETGTFFLNRCDYLDPGLAWVGVKQSGRGCSLSKFGFDQLTRPKSYHLRLPA